MNSTIFGRIGRDAVLKEVGSTNVAKFSVALSFYQKGSERGTQWVNVDLFGTRAEKLSDYLTKGTAVAVTGDLKVRTYEKNDGGTGISLDMNAESVALLGGGQQRETEETTTDEPTAESSDEDAASF